MTDGTAYRVEFVLPEGLNSWVSSAPFATGGNQSDVQFLTGGSTTTFGVSNPADYCEENPFLTVPCFVNGDIDSPDGPFDALVRWEYDDFGGVGDATNDVQSISAKSDIGSTFGSAFNTQTRTLFLASVLKRHNGLGPDGLGAIYAVDPFSGTPNGDLFATIPDVGTIGDDVARGLDGLSPSDSSIDSTAFPLAMKIGLGDIDFDPISNKLYVVNLNNRKVYILNATTGAIQSSVDIPDPGCTDGDYRPFGLKVHEGFLYAGVVCDASTSADDATGRANLTASVFKMNLATEVFSPTSVLTFPLNYARDYAWRRNNTGAGGETIGNDADVGSSARWNIWKDVYSDANFNRRVDNDRGISHPTPILTDLEFDDNGNLYLGFSDRVGFQFGENNFPPNNDANLILVFASGGDLLKATPNGASYDIEILDYPAESIQDPAEFFNFEEIVRPHSETAQGGLVIKPGTDEIATTIMDPINTFAGGIKIFSLVDGSTTDSLEIYRQAFNNNQGYAGKGVGLGDLELLCAAPPIEIGNYVWIDANNNGIQDADEAPVADIIVSLYDSNGLLIGQDTTSNIGQYYFNQSNVDTTGITIDGSGDATPTSGGFTGLDYNSQYFIVFGDGQYGDTVADKFSIAGTDYGITSANSGSNDNIDSDVNGNSLTSALGDRPAGLPFIELTTTGTSFGDHSYDMGLSDSNCTVTASVIAGDQSICSGADPVVFTVTTAATGSGTLTYQWQSSTTDCTTGFTDIDGATSATYDAPALTATTYYQVIIINDGICQDMSNCVMVTVNPSPTVTVNSPVVCDGNSATVTASPSGGDGSYTYAWTVPATASAQGNVASFSTMVAGTYTVTVTDGNTCVNTASGTVTINANPAVTVNSPAVCDGGSATVTASPSGGDGSYTYAWTVPATASAPGNVASFSTIVAGTYTVTVTDGNTCVNTASGTVTVNALPTCSISGSSSVASNTQDISYAAPAGMTTYAWNITSGDATIDGASNAQNVTIDFGANASTIQLIITDANGCMSTCDLTVSTSLNCSINGPTETCTNTTGLTFTGPADATTYAWSITAGDATINGSSTAQSVTVDAGSNDFTIALTVAPSTSPTCSQMVTVNPLPTANIASIALCDDGDGTVDFDLTSVENTVTGGASGVTVAWFTDMALISSIATPAAHASSGGTVYAQVTNTTTNCTASAAVTLTVNPLPTLAAASTNPTTCNAMDGSITLTLTNVADGNYTINYQDASATAQTFTNVAVSGGSATITNLTAGTYNNLSITDSNTCTSTEDVDITLTHECYSLGNQVFTDTDNSGDLNGSETGIDGVTLQLLNNDGSVYDSDPNTPGDQALTVTTANGGYYRFDDLPADDYIVEVIASNFTSGNNLDGFNSSTGVNQEADPDSDGDINDNGLDTQVNGATRSGIVTLGTPEPSGETEPGSYAAGSTTGTAATDLFSNLTVDFGFMSINADYANPIAGFPPCPEQPCHIVNEDLKMGALISGDDPNVMATDDADGTIFPNNLRAGISIRVRTSITNNTGLDAYLYAWVDWNNDDDFDDSGENFIAATYPTATFSGTFEVSNQVFIPSTTNTTDQIAMRFRLSSDQAATMSPCGSATCAADGEVEDYLIQLECPPMICLPPTIQINRE